MLNEKLIEILPNLHLIKNKEDIGKATRLQDDLQLYDEDLVDFIVTYSEVFSVDISSFDLNSYFSGRPLFRKFSKFKKKRRTITMGDLDRAIPLKKINNQILMEILEPLEVGNSKKLVVKQMSRFASSETIAYLAIGIISSILLTLVALYL